jgi:hypothetical protein
MKFGYLVGFVLLAGFTVHSVLADDPNKNPTNAIYEVRSPATKSLAIFKTLVTSANYKSYGFESASEVAQATNGQAILIYPIRFDLLQTYVPNQSLLTLLAPFDRAIVPVMVGTNVRSSLTMRLIPDQSIWTNDSWGQPRLIKSLVQIVSQIPSAEIQSGSVPFGVEVPVFDMWFVGYRDPNGNTVFRSLFEIPPLNLQSGAVVPAATMAYLADLSKKYTGPP